MDGKTAALMCGGARQGCSVGVIADGAWGTAVFVLTLQVSETRHMTLAPSIDKCS